VVAALCGSEVIAPYSYDWTTKSGWFEVWFEWHLCPLLRCGTVIILDNASFHRKPTLERIAAFYGHRILWLPTYSPDKNRIEKLWANLKNWLRLYFDDSAFLNSAVMDYLQSA
jgi:transposase